MTTQINEYDEFYQRMINRFPKILGSNFGGFCVGKGWWPILEILCANIQHHIDHCNSQYENQKQGTPVQQVVAVQIKEKFGGLRFYYNGGDDVIQGMIYMAESWANHVCEECGSPATKKTSGWIKTVCDKHYNEYIERFNKFSKE